MLKTPEDWLEKASTPQKSKGIFKLFLGYAPGVGKTYSMLSEGIRRHNRGEDVVIGFIETHGRKGIEDLVPELETIPRRGIEYKGTMFEEMDVDAIIARHPVVVLVDELAHTNIPGSKHRKRYEDLLELLNAKIDVLSTLNIQHMESLAPTVHSITGVTVRETVPDWVPLMANETVMVDLTPEALQQRMERGDVYSKHKVHQALHNFFRRGNLIALRELALRQVAEHVDRSLESYMAAKDIEKNWPVRERLAVCISSNPSGQYLIARGARMARRLDAELYVVHVDTGGDDQGPSHKSLEANIRFAGDLGAKVVRIKGKNIPDTMAAFAREKHVTQVIFGRAAVKGLRKLLYLSAIHRFLRDAPAVDVHIVTHQEPD
ncbi:MAG: two-component system, OmpR family, sensor histidine kinase KdpD [Acidobacteriaceae bacterium]|jgi:two-component system sensor histidine kinase KdpD|nr:two-component system, OmpR family, sensor histidine kinase KdpD [Acidobacteriaceae bacterium]